MFWLGLFVGVPLGLFLYRFFGLTQIREELVRSQHDLVLAREESDLAYEWLLKRN